MFSATLRNKIVSSYALVLSDLLKSDDNAVNTLNALSNFVSDNDLKLSEFIINPSVLQKYNNVLLKLEKTFDKKDAICSFINQIARRRYLFLLNDIIEKAKYNMRDKFNGKKVIVYSSDELCEDIKTFINNVLKEKIGNAVLEYKINRNLKSDTVDFVSDGKICSINLNNVSNIFFKY